MKSSMLLFLLFAATTGLASCSSDEVAISVKQAEPAKELSAEVKEVKVNEAPAEASSPAEASLAQYEVILEDGESKFPTKESLIMETTVGNSSILALHSPEGEDHYAVFLYSFDEQWYIEGVMRLAYSEDEAYTDKVGLALPMTRFNTANIKIGEGKEVWAFAGAEELITIARYDRFAFESAGAQPVSLSNGVDAFINKDQFNNRYLYYFDSEKLITVSGNVSEEELVDLASSLPSALSAFFPASTN